MTGHGSARVRPALPSRQTYARQRLVAGLVGGFAAQLVLAFVLGIVLVGGFSLGVRVFATVVSSVIATPLLFSLGFACMLKPDARPFGGGLVAGALLSSILLLVGYLVS